MIASSLICPDCGNKYKDNPVFGVNPDSVTYDHAKEKGNKKEDKTETKEYGKYLYLSKTFNLL